MSERRRIPPPRFLASPLTECFSWVGGDCAWRRGADRGVYWRDWRPHRPEFLTGTRHPPLTAGKALHTVKYGKNPSIEIASFRSTFSSEELASGCLCAAMTNSGERAAVGEFLRGRAPVSGVEERLWLLDLAYAALIRFRVPVRSGSTGTVRSESEGCAYVLFI